MKQLLQNLRDGKTMVSEVPLPMPRPGTALVRTAASLVSAGTERTLVAFAEKNLVAKAQSRPDLVRQVIDKARREGLLTTIEAAFNKLDQPMPLGYSSAGTVVAVGRGLHGLQVGDRVACAGGGYAVHAEYAIVPGNLLAKLPDTVDFESAAFTTLGAIALHGFRLAQPQLGERVAIIGLGLLGLLTVGITRAAGCQAFGVDLDAGRVALAERLGARAALRPDAETAGAAFSQGRGFDAVLVCADARSNDPIELAGALCRDRGRVIAVGAFGLDIPRKLYFEKEIHFQVSRSYGPGRYDPNYEEDGRDYPIGYVRWTEGRNLQGVVDLLACGALDVKPLITHRFIIDEAPQAYDLITGKTGQPFLGILLTYPQPVSNHAPQTRIALVATEQPPSGELNIGVLGAGNYAASVFLPAVRKVGGVRLTTIVSAQGMNAVHLARKYGFQNAASDERQVLEDGDIQVVALLTRHAHHARQVCAALAQGKHVYCEKPLAVTPAQLDDVVAALQQAKTLLAVGFNRRFAPLAAALNDFLEGRSEPLAAHYRVNAGYIPLTHWLHDPEQGGGRIIGEGCHFIDFLSFLAGAPPISVSAQGLPDGGRYRQDNVVITLAFPDGSLGTVTYLANGDKSYPKERLEVFSSGRVAVLDDFRSLEMIKDGRRRRLRSRLTQDKGHAAAWRAFLEAIRKGGPPPVAYEQILGVTRAAFAAVDALASGETMPVDRKAS
ncbi:MAG: bi-domain-containing oxidoreductase [Anaerolineaceae bacterium]|jgi:predicted dehydrogenase/threonine dehydrogenase-like Zn-dependent dehydrogenase